MANEACDAGRVLVNDKPAKASAQVKTGDTSEIQFGSRNVKVEVLEMCIRDRKRIVHEEQSQREIQADRQWCEDFVRKSWNRPQSSAQLKCGVCPTLSG